MNITKICIFDFDGTLIFTPQKPKCWYGSWWGNKVSLTPPHLKLTTDILNSTVIEAYLTSTKAENEFTVMMTGRHLGLKNYVLNILTNFGLTPKLNDKRERAVFTESYNTLEFKKEQIKEFLQEFPNAHTLFIWEDRETHIEEFKRLGNLLQKKHPNLTKFQVFNPPNWHSQIS